MITNFSCVIQMMRMIKKITLLFWYHNRHTKIMIDTAIYHEQTVIASWAITNQTVIKNTPTTFVSKCFYTGCVTAIHLGNLLKYC